MLRREGVLHDKLEALAAESPDSAGATAADGVDDDELAMILMCCHPALPRPARVLELYDDLLALKPSPVVALNAPSRSPWWRGRRPASGRSTDLGAARSPAITCCRQRWERCGGGRVRQ